MSVRTLIAFHQWST